LICFGLAAEKLFEQNVFLKGCGLQPHRKVEIRDRTARL